MRGAHVQLLFAPTSRAWHLSARLATAALPPYRLPAAFVKQPLIALVYLLFYVMSLARPCPAALALLSVRRVNKYDESSRRLSS